MTGGTAFALRGERILVTGASGFVGSHLLRVLEARGAVVAGTGHEIDGPPGLDTWLRADLVDASAVAAAVARVRPRAIVHLAGQASAGRSFRAPQDTFRVNVAGTWNVLEAVRARSPDARVLVVGSGEAYGPQREGTRVRENAPFGPVSPYALSKAVADEVAGEFAVRHGLDVIRTRSFSHTGPGQTPGFALPSWAQQIVAIEGRGKGELLVGNLDVTRDILDVRDVAECYARLLESGVRGEAYNVCRGEGIRLKEIVELMVRSARAPLRVLVDPQRVRPADVEYLVGDPAKTVRATGWAPSRSVQVMVDDLLESWRRSSRT